MAMNDKHGKEKGKKRPYAKPHIIAEEEMSIEFCKPGEPGEKGKWGRQRCPRS